MLPALQEDYVESLPAHEISVLNQVMACTVAGNRAKVGGWIRDLVASTGADEVMIDCRIQDVDARMRYHQYVAEALA